MIKQKLLLSSLAAAASAFIVPGIARSQTPPAGTWSPPPPPGATQSTTISGTVSRFSLAPRGELDGVILSDGTEVHTPPHLSQQLAAAIQKGDQVRIQGWQSVTPGVIAATTITDLRDGEMVVDQGPPPPGTMPPPLPPGYPAPGAQFQTVQGQIQRDLHGPAGDINGVLLADGTELKVPPPVAYQVAPMLQPGQRVAAQGYLLSSGYGSVMDVQALGPSSERMTQLGWAPGGAGGLPPAPPAGQPPVPGR